MPLDLRTYLADLQDRFPEEIVRTKKPVDPSWEISAVVRRFEADNRFPAVLFENPTGYSMPVLSNLFASRRRLAAAFGTIPENVTLEYARREDNLLKPEMVSSGPVQEVVHQGDDVDLHKLPIVTHCEKDGGAFITPGVTVMRDPETGIRNAGIYRIQLMGRNRLGLGLGPVSDGGHILRVSEGMGRDLEVAVVLGHHPTMCLGAQSRSPLYVDELEVMGGLMGEPLPIVKCKTVDLEVPAYAEIVIEGKLRVGVREPEGPFGEYTWYYGPPRPNPVIEVTAITHRHDAIFHDLMAAHIDHNYCGLLGREALLYKRVKQVVPTVKAVCLPESGCCRYVGYVQIKKEFDGQSNMAALAALASDPYVKIAVVVDDDVNPYSDREMIWAIATRTQPDRQFFFVPNVAVCVLDPASYGPKSRTEGDGMNTKLGIDATKPVGLPFAERAQVKRENWERINLEDYIG